MYHQRYSALVIFLKLQKKKKKKREAEENFTFIC